MIRYACLLVVVSVAFCVSSFAQPARLWKRDGHYQSSEVVGIDRDSRYIYTQVPNWLYQWDVEADTVVKRLAIQGTAIAFMNDSTILVDQGWLGWAHMRASDGTIVLTSNGQVMPTWWDRELRIAFQWSAQGGDSIILSDPKSLRIIARAASPLRFREITGYDAQKKLLYALRSNSLWTIDLLGQQQKLMDFDSGAAEIVDVLVVDDGTLLACEYKYMDSSSRVIAIDPVLGIHFDSLIVQGPVYSSEVLTLLNATPYVIHEPASGVMQVLARNPLRWISTHAIEHPRGRLLVRSFDSVYFSDTRSTVSLFNPVAASLTEVIPSRQEVVSATQLRDGRIVISQKDIDPIVIDVRTGDDVESLWRKHPHVNRNGYDTYTLLAAKDADIIAVGTGGSVRLLSTTDTVTNCVATAYVDVLLGSMSLVTPAWLNKRGTELITRFSSHPDHRVSNSRFVGFDKSADPCIDYYLPLVQYATFIREEKSEPTIRNMSVSEDGKVAFVSVYEVLINGSSSVHMFTGIMAAQPYNTGHRVFPGLSAGVILNDGIHGVLEHENGVAIVSSVDTLLFTTVPLGTRHLPLSMLHADEYVLTYADNAVHCIDLYGGVKVWSMPVASQPSSILVDRDDRWFLCLYPDDYIEMFALDTTVSVGARSIDATRLHVYPNPASETLSIRAPFPMLEYALHDVLGNRVLSIVVRAPSTTCTANIEVLANGTYVLSATSSLQRATAVVHKQR